MTGNSRYDVLFEPVAIGPVTAKNRFYQVPHCCGMGHLRPNAHAAMRGVKAQGGWAVVSTEEAEIHPSSDLSPYPEQRIWDEKDIPALRLMTDKVHEHGSLAAIELVHNGNHAPNLYSRIVPLAVTEMAIDTDYPKQARAMNKKDIRELRRWHRAAARRSMEAGFDIVYVYAGHGMTLTQQFLLPELNTRQDEYGGSLENRARLLKEILQDTKDEVGDKCAVALRFAVDEMKGDDGMQSHEEGHAVVEMLAELPDLWDVNVSDWSNDSITTRFQQDEGYQLPYTQFVKSVTTKPVVSVGKFTSPDLMVSLINKGVLDFIGAARPSIADPYLPHKIQHDRIDEIRECIGCNICVSSDCLGIPIRCTQNPTMGEEWRRNWHPEKIDSAKTAAATLVVGAGPAGLECALQLARRGFEVIISEAGDQLGGRAVAESALQGLSAWRRVCDNRVYELQQKPNVSIFTASELSVAEIIELGCDKVFIATGAMWRGDGIGRSRRRAIEGIPSTTIISPESIMAGELPDQGPLVLFDDDHGYMGGVLADHLAQRLHQRDGQIDICFITSASVVSPWTENTLEQARVQRALIEQGVKIYPNLCVSRVTKSSIVAECVFSGRESEIDCQHLLLVTQRKPVTELFDALQNENVDAEIIGDASAPGLIADAVYAGHLAARNFQADPVEIEAAMFRREIPALNH